MTDVALVPLSWIRTAAFAAALLVVSVFALGRCSANHDSTIAAATARVETLTVVRAAVAETVKARLLVKLRTDTLVQTLSDTQLVVRETPAAPPETVVVQPRIVERIAACDAFASSCQRQLAVDSSVIQGLRDLVALQRPPRRFGLAVTAGPSCNQRGCDIRVTAGISWRIR